MRAKLRHINTTARVLRLKRHVRANVPERRFGPGARLLGYDRLDSVRVADDPLGITRQHPEQGVIHPSGRALTPAIDSPSFPSNSNARAISAATGNSY
jgi:hypothetical protein